MFVVGLPRSQSGVALRKATVENERNLTGHKGDVLALLLVGCRLITGCGVTMVISGRDLILLGV
jgi:hypothetical protein